MALYHLYKSNEAEILNKKEFQLILSKKTKKENLNVSSTLTDSSTMLKSIRSPCAATKISSQNEKPPRPPRKLTANIGESIHPPV